jgi:hypothetical protein
MASEHYSFQAKDLLDRFVQRWMWVVALGVLGAMVGFLLSIMLPAKYEAAASILMNFDYSRTVEQELVVEDRVLDRVWHLLISDETFREVLERLVESEGEFEAWGSIEALRENTRFDARLSRWEFIGIHTDPKIAVVIADTWKEVALERIDEAMEHAWKVQSLQGFTFDVACVEQVIVEEWDDVLTCVTIGEGISAEIIDELREEILASHGLLPVISYEPFQNASLPEAPVLWPRGLLIFSGAMIGFILGFVSLIVSSQSQNSENQKIQNENHDCRIET